MAEEGVIRLLLHDDTVFPQDAPLQDLDLYRAHQLNADLARILVPDQMQQRVLLLQLPELAEQPL